MTSVYHQALGQAKGPEIVATPTPAHDHNAGLAWPLCFRAPVVCLAHDECRMHHSTVNPRTGRVSAGPGLSGRKAHVRHAAGCPGVIKGREVRVEGSPHLLVIDVVQRDGWYL